VYVPADRLLEMGFKPAINKILSFIPKERQTLLFSATVRPVADCARHVIGCRLTQATRVKNASADIADTGPADVAGHVMRERR
jgi:superfamily II DNA/RNA helicase